MNTKSNEQLKKLHLSSIYGKYKCSFCETQPTEITYMGRSLCESCIDNILTILHDKEKKREYGNNRNPNKY